MNQSGLEIEFELVEDTELPTGNLVIRGEYSIHNASEIKKGLLTSLKKVDVCNLELLGFNRMDLSIIQLLLAAKKSATEQGKQLTFVGESKDQVLDFFKLYGFESSEWESQD